MVIQSPPGWVWDHIRGGVGEIGSATPEDYYQRDAAEQTPIVRRIGVADLREALREGLADFEANRTDLIFVCLIYPVLGLVLGRLASGHGLLPLLFPLASGFALVGPFAAIGLNEMSRRRELGAPVRWVDAFGVLRSPAIGSILLLGLLLTGLFLLWLIAAQVIFNATLGPVPPVSASSFIHDVLATPAGWAMIGIGVSTGFVFAALAFAISVVSFPMLLDRNVGIGTAIATSLQTVVRNPGVMALWGLIVAASLVIGMLPLFIGLVVVLPVLGHATWHLYRKVAPMR